MGKNTHFILKIRIFNTYFILAKQHRLNEVIKSLRIDGGESVQQGFTLFMCLCVKLDNA